MFTSLRLTQGRLKRVLHAVEAPNLSGGQQLSKLLGQGPVYAAGAYDGVSAKLVESSGFKAVYVPGSAVSASVTGQPTWATSVWPRWPRRSDGSPPPPRCR
ncbi:hypothetical protein [Nocardioides daphniae]|uniref:Uncharacterized protein n=1 Tax=Nocardioides daphniae TaxID=402297 RepID=A0A4P7UCB5_9ACTN|nr:hypothetical protein [Nocardioides daphniae]QCC77780.1 hypothetical protein E2C04_12355 [Nocardioides daphniae]GGD28503.1 hypothetical protein GCM10007231_30020 [Nocardioides daphniae]